MMALILVAVSSICAQDAKILEQKQGSITFAVDENLQWRSSSAVPMNTVSKADGYIAASFLDTPLVTGRTPFFHGMVRAFAEHRPVTLSPDVIWMLVSQNFNHDVNADPEAFRDKFVDFDGKVDLVVESAYPLGSSKFDWTGTVDGFADKIRENTNGDIAKTLTAGFTTTGTVERIASEVVLMGTTQAYFEFVVMYLGCGIPSVTLTGTVQDWQSVLDRTNRLVGLGAGSWASDLIPILEQFVLAADGRPDQAFWQDIVMINHPGSLERGGACGLTPSTLLDGWFLKFLPYDKNGNRMPRKVEYTFDGYPEQMASAPALYLEVDPVTGNIIESVNLKLSGGIAGYVSDTATCGISFQIGWAVQKADGYELADKLKNHSGALDLRVTKVPEELRAVPHFDNLRLRFTGKVVIPDWMDDMDIQFLHVQGELSDAEKLDLKNRFHGHIGFLDPEVTAVRFNDGNPLVIVDGTIWEIDPTLLDDFDWQGDSQNTEKVAALLGISPDDIMNISVLKDAEATTIWGTRGRNGVLEVQTSHLKKEKRRSLISALMDMARDRKKSKKGDH